MTGFGTFGISAAHRDYPLRGAALRVSKPYSANRFDGEREEIVHEKNSARENTGGEIPSRFETERARTWNGPRLNPAFAAQVLGQILIKNEYNPGSAVAAYGERTRKFPLACDLTA
jgi:hypothetical protein